MIETVFLTTLRNMTIIFTNQSKVNWSVQSFIDF